ncbi:uncharacterized protein rrp8 [Xenentodon cancila]
MFNEDEDWNDEQDDRVLSKGVQGNRQKTSSTHLKSTVVGKKSLLRTLQTLGPVPEWKSSDQEQDSGSETGAAPSHTQRKKKKRRKRKPAEKSEEQPKNGELSHTVQKDEPVPKKKKVNKPGTPKLNSTSAGETKGEEITESARVCTNKLEGKEKMTRQQWKNKMKNKRKCKNKYRQNEPEDDVNKVKASDKQEAKEIKINSHSSNNNSQNLVQPAVQKQKKRQKDEKTKSDVTEKSGSESSGDGSKREAGEVQITKDQQILTKNLKHELNKDQVLKRKRLWRILNSHDTDRDEKPADQQDTAAVPEEKEEEVKQSRSDSLRSRMEQRLESARFRYINEVLYTTTSGEAKRMFQQDPQAFRIYHKGYTAQVQRWPANPVDVIISDIQKKPPSLVVADFGCGDCKIARSVKNKVHSFDLAATCELVTVCDMSKVPLGDCSVDVAVFCLSLMGTNLPDFLAEANRVLKTGGILKIAEVASRFDNVRNFITALANLGFKMMSKETENTHFYSFEFMKTRNALKNTKKVQLQLRPCVYKKR